MVRFVGRYICVCVLLGVLWKIGGISVSLGGRDQYFVVLGQTCRLVYQFMFFSDLLIICVYGTFSLEGMSCLLPYIAEGALWRFVWVIVGWRGLFSLPDIFGVCLIGGILGIRRGRL